MNKFKKITSVILASAMVSSVAGTFNVLADNETNYTFYTQVGETFTPQTDGVTWDSTTVDTSVMGRRIITGTKDGTPVEGIVNVGTKKYSGFANMEDKSENSNLNYGVKDEWAYGDSKSAPASYVSKPLTNGDSNIALCFTMFNSTATSETDQRNTRLGYTLTNLLGNSGFETTFRIAFGNLKENTEQQATLNFRDDKSGGKEVTKDIVIKQNSNGTISAKINGGSNPTVKVVDGWVWLKVVYNDTANQFELYVYISYAVCSAFKFSQNGHSCCLYFIGVLVELFGNINLF